jgi:hypothetical protein
MTTRPEGSSRGTVLVLPVKGIYFDQMKAGTKVFEYRLRTPYWRKRLEGRTYEKVCVTRGYPSASDNDRRLVVAWRGYEEQTLTHEFFGPDPVDVFAIRIDLQAS